MSPAEDSSRMKTCSRNASTHPGLVDKSTKRARGEVPTQKQVAAEKKASKEAKRVNAVNAIADIEKQMALKDADDKTPRAKTKKAAPRQLQRTESYLNIPLTMPEETVDDSEEDMDVDSADNHTRGPASTNQNISDDNASSEVDAPPKKKSKTAKVGIRTSIKDVIAKEKRDKAPEGRRKMADGSVTMVSRQVK